LLNNAGRTEPPVDPDTEGSWPVCIEQAPSGALFVGAYNWSHGAAATWVLFKLIDIAADTIFASDFD